MEVDPMTAENKYCTPAYSLRFTTGRIGLTMLFHTMLINLLFILSDAIEVPVRTFASAHAGIFGAEAADIAVGSLEAASYLMSFMLPVAFFAIITPRAVHRPMNLGVRLPSCTWAVILFALAANTAASYVNFYVMSGIGVPSEPSSESSGGAVGIILSFINIALVPALCEEFLFRGCILAALLPYGKTTAVIGSAVLFSLMHNNFAQFFYTCIAGIILGAVYVATGSIWAGTFVHLFNNFSSVVLSALYERTTPETAAVISALYDSALLAAGLAAGVALVLHEKKQAEWHGDVSYATDSGSRGTLRGFFAPAMIVYFAVAILAALVLR